MLGEAIAQPSHGRDSQEHIAKATGMDHHDRPCQDGPYHVPEKLLCAIWEPTISMSEMTKERPAGCSKGPSSSFVVCEAIPESVDLMIC
jgi:hypothetical protein